MKFNESCGLSLSVVREGWRKKLFTLKKSPFNYIWGSWNIYSFLNRIYFLSSKFQFFFYFYCVNIPLEQLFKVRKLFPQKIFKNFHAHFTQKNPSKKLFLLSRVTSEKFSKISLRVKYERGRFAAMSGGAIIMGVRDKNLWFTLCLFPPVRLW